METPQELKKKGNMAFLQKSHQEAVMYYTMAIEASDHGEVDHTFFANRAAVFLEIAMFDNCISDCDKCLKIDPTFVKCYYRKAKALIESKKSKEAMEVLSKGIQLTRSNDLQELMDKLKKDTMQEGPSQS